MTSAENPNGPAAFWDARYAEADYAFGATANTFLMSQAHRLHPGQRALVPGDGEGRNGVWLAAQGLQVDTVDASPKGVAKARQLAVERGVSVNAVVADLVAWPWPQRTYDVVVSIFLHFSENQRAAMHAKMLRCLQPGGLVLLEAYRPRQLELHKTGTVGGPQDIAMLMTRERLVADFADADIVDISEAEVDLSEGRRHTGRSAVIRLIARRR